MGEDVTFLPRMSSSLSFFDETQKFKTALRCYWANLKTACDPNIKARLGRKCRQQRLRNFLVER